MNRVAKITFGFWIMKICATTLGETGGDLLSMTLNLGYAISLAILLSFFLITVVAKISIKRFNSILYWTVILSTSTAGTEISDLMDRTFKLGYTRGSIILVSILFIVLAIWYFTEKTLSVENIETTRAETFYWIAILFSNTLGTALGDFLADSSGLGFLGSALLIGGLIGLITLAYLFTNVNRIALFWFAFVLTRPFGATFGDLLTKPTTSGGLNLGTVGSSAVLFSLLLLFMTFTVLKDKQEKVLINKD
jgi:uncharacterized membrane-anchored protein